LTLDLNWRDIESLTQKHMFLNETCQ